MANTTEGFLNDALSAVDYAHGGQFRPTLVIGLGGSGVETARRVKRLLHERYTIKDLIGFLFIDTDQGQYIGNTELAPVDSKERAAIMVRNPEQILEEFDRPTKLHPYYEHFLTKELNVALLRDASGAAGIRPVGRFAFFASFDTLYPQFLEPAVDSIVQVQARAKALMSGAERNVEITPSQPRVYIISSLCGGTGSGIFLDTAVVMRHIFSQRGLDGEIVGIFYLPSVFQHEAGISPSMKEVIEANAYASLMELEYFCDPETFDHKDPDLLQFTYPMINDITLREPLLDEVFLVESINSRGESLSTKHWVFEMVARSVMLDIGSPLGAHARSIKRNSQAVIELLPCAETKKHRLMSSLGVTTLTVPIKELVLYCAARAAESIWQDETPSEETVDVAGQVDSLMQSLHVRQDDVDWLLEQHFLLDDHGARIEFPTPGARRLLESAQDAGHSRPDKQAQYLAEELQRIYDKLEQTWLPEQKKQINERAKALRNRFRSEVETAGAGTLRRLKHDATIQFFAECEERLREFETQLTNKVDELRSKQKEAKKRYEDAVNGLKNTAFGRLDLLFKKADITPQLERTLKALKDYATASLELLAAEHAHSALSQDVGEGEEQAKAVLNALGDWSEIVHNWKTHEERTLSELQEWKDKKDRIYGHHDLEWLAMLKPDFESFYQSLQIPVENIRRGYLEEKKKEYTHYPAFGGYSKYEITPKADAQLRLKAAVQELIHLMPEKANIVELIDRTQSDGQNGNKLHGEYLRRKLSLLFDTCQPYWSTSHPPGERRYESFVVCSVPGTGEEHADELRKAVRELAEERGARAEYREDGYPYALTVMTRTYGARAYYLRSTERMRTFYERRAKDAIVRTRLHVDQRFHDRLPRLEPPKYREEELQELVAWAVAFGYIAQQKDAYYWSVTQYKGKHVPRYTTEWPLALKDVLPADWTKHLLRRADKKDLLGNNRKAVLQALVLKEEYIGELKAARAQVVDALGLETVMAELEEYMQTLIERNNEARTEQEKERYPQEDIDALGRYLNELDARLIR